MKKSICWIILAVMLLTLAGCGGNEPAKEENAQAAVTATPTVETTAEPTAEPTLAPTAEPLTSSDEQYDYVLLEDGTAEITAFRNHGVITADGKRVFGYTLVIPPAIDGYTVSAIGDRAFIREGALTGVTIPDGVKTIGECAFFCCKIYKVTIPNSVTSIGNGAFASCHCLKSVTIPDGVTKIGDCAFYDCNRMTSVTIPDSVTEMGVNPFEACGRLAEIIVSSEHPYLAVVDGVLFSKPDKRLILYPYRLEQETYEIPQGIRLIGYTAFSDCLKLTSVIIPDSVTTIDDNAFLRCYNLTNVIIPNSVTEIGVHAFSSCDNLTLTVTQGSYAEQYCKENNLKYQYADAQD